MIKKGEWVKFIIISAICFLIFLPFSYLKAQQIEPPGLETGKNLLHKTSSSSRSFVGRVGEKIRNWLFAIVPFLEKINFQVAEWWNNSAKPWLIQAYNNFSLFWNREIIID